MPIRFSSRRRLIFGLAAGLPLASLMRAEDVSAAQGDDAFLRVSQIITGSQTLSSDASNRIHRLLAARNKTFDAQLLDLAGMFPRSGGDRGTLLSHLSPAQVRFALTIAKPWYLGYVGTPSNFVMKDDAAFATFLEAQSFQKVIEFLPRPTYPRGTAGSWAKPPQGVDSPAMPEQIKDWTFHPGGPSTILTPDPNWKLYATAKHASVEEARKNKPQPATTAGQS